MGRRKKPTKELVAGTVYIIDRRINSFVVFRSIVSRQTSKNLHHINNYILFKVLPSPNINTVFVVKHVKLFGKHYAKVLVSNSEQGTEVGYVSLMELERVCRGKLKWKLTD
jgi:hypothetical protein